MGSEQVKYPLVSQGYDAAAHANGDGKQHDADGAYQSAQFETLDAWISQPFQHLQGSQLGAKLFRIDAAQLAVGVRLPASQRVEQAVVLVPGAKLFAS